MAMKLSSGARIMKVPATIVGKKDFPGCLHGRKMAHITGIAKKRGMVYPEIPKNPAAAPKMIPQRKPSRYPASSPHTSGHEARHLSLYVESPFNDTVPGIVRSSQGEAPKTAIKIRGAAIFPQNPSIIRNFRIPRTNIVPHMIREISDDPCSFRYVCPEKISRRYEDLPTIISSSIVVDCCRE